MYHQFSGFHHNSGMFELTKRSVLIMSFLNVLLVVSLLIAWMSTEEELEPEKEKVQISMTPEEVVAVIGQPRAKTMMTAWHYGEGYRGFGKYLRILFNKEGKVVDVKREEHICGTVD